jgi:bifunctional non-homologous end joining protein LigD
MPIAWSELGRIRSGDAFTITNTLQRLRRRKVDPWAEIGTVRQTLPVAGRQR